MEDKTLLSVAAVRKDTLLRNEKSQLKKETCILLTEKRRGRIKSQ